MIPAIQQNFPAPAEAVVDQTLRISQPWRFFLLALYNRTGGPNGIPLTTGDFVAAGSTRETATSLENDICSISGSGGGILQSLQPGEIQTVFNTDAVNTITIYGNSSYTVDAGTSYALAAGKAQVFTCTDANTIRTLQLG